MIYLKSQYLSWLLIYVKFWVNCIFLKGTHISPPPDLIGLIKTYTTLANKNWGAFYWPLRTKLKILRYTLILNWAKFYEVMIYFAFLQTIILLVPPGVSPENFKKIAHLELEIFKINLISVSKWGNEQTDRHTRNMKLFRTSAHMSKECLQKIWKR